MRIIAVIVLAAIGCQVESTYKVTTIPPAELRATLVRTPPDSSVTFPAEPPLPAVTMRAATLAKECQDPTSTCPLDEPRLARASLQIATGTRRRPNWHAIGVRSLIVAVDTAAIAGEVYCFEDCPTGGKIALGVVDGLAVGLAAVAAVALGAMLKMNN